MRYHLYVHLPGSVTFNTGSSVQSMNLVLSSKPDLSFSKCLSLSAKLAGEGDSGKGTPWEWGSLCTPLVLNVFHPLLQDSTAILSLLLKC